MYLTAWTYTCFEYGIDEADEGDVAPQDHLSASSRHPQRSPVSHELQRSPLSRSATPGQPSRRQCNSEQSPRDPCTSCLTRLACSLLCLPRTLAGRGPLVAPLRSAGPLLASVLRVVTVSVPWPTCGRNKPNAARPMPTGNRDALLAG